MIAPVRPSPRAEPWLGVLAGAAAFGVPFAFFTGLVLHQFYVKGSFLLDAGWFAYVMSVADPRLPNPLSLGGGSFFAVHISPIFLATALVRRGLPVSDAQFFAGFIGVCHALPALGVYWVLRAGFRLRGGGGILTAALAAIAFAFNGLSLAIARYPHYEILIVGSVILFAVALVQRSLIAAAICFALALATREDSGFHLFAILCVLIALNRWRGLPWRDQRAEIAFAVIALTCSLAALAVQLTIATGPSAFMRIYLGDPPFAKFTAETILERLLGYGTHRAYLVLPALIAALWAIRTRNPYILVGYVAFLPWGLLHLVAHSDIAGTLSGYYAFPFMIASCWPLVGVLLDWRRRGIEGRAAPAVLSFAAMTAASFVALTQQYNPGQVDLATGFLVPPAPLRQALTERAVAELVRSKPFLGAVAVDGSVVALAPDGFSWSETVQGRGTALPDAVVYFVQGYESATARRIAAASGLEVHYRVTGTAIRIAAARPIVDAAPIATLVVPADTPE